MFICQNINNLANKENDNWRDVGETILAKLR